MNKKAMTVFAIVLISLLIWWHAIVLAPFVLSFSLAYVLKPGVSFLVRKRVPLTLAAGLSVFGTFLLLIILILLLVPIAVELGPQLQQQLPILVSDAWNALFPLLTQAGIKVPADLADLKHVMFKFFQDHANELGNTLFRSAMIGGSWLMTLLGFVVLVPVLVFYFLLDWQRLVKGFDALIPVPWRPAMNDFMDEANDVMGHYLRGQILVMFILAVYYSLGLWLFGFNLAWPIGVFTGLAVFIPYIGFGLGLILAFLSGVLQFTAGGESVGWPLLAVAVVYGSGQLLESIFLTPKLVGERIGLHPVGVIFALMIFAYWMGFIGVLIALPLSALAMIAVRRAFRRYQRSALFLGQS